MIKIENLEHLKSVEEVFKTAKVDFTKFDITAMQTRSKGFSLKINKNEIYIEYSNLISLYNSLLEVTVNEKEEIVIEKEMFNKNMGIMLDCARNAAINLSALRKFICNSALLGYNYIKLYVEDLMKLDDEQYFGYMRGSYSKEEIKEINDYCEFIGVELIPCVQTLAHLNQIFKWGDYRAINDYDDILLIGEDKTYDLIEKMIKFSRETTTSKRINIGMDEAEMVGLGKYLKKNGYKNRFEIMQTHLEKVIKICKKYDFTPEIWSDMYFKLRFGEYYVPHSELGDDLKSYIPKELNLIYWDYYHLKESDYLAMIKNHKQLTNNVVFAGGLWTWRGYVPYNKYAEATMFPAIEACRKENVDDLFFTMWGDNGGECSRFSVFSSMVIVAEKCYDSEIDLDKVSRMIKVLTGYTYEDFIKLDDLNCIYTNGTPSNTNPSKFLLFNDIFVSSFDDYLRIDLRKYYSDLANELEVLANKENDFSYIFNTEAKLSRALSYKADLSKRIKEAYDLNDNNLLEQCVMDIDNSIKYIQEFYDSFRRQWFKENRSFGFEIQDARIGGLIFRLKHCKNTLVKFINHEISEIEELNEERKSFSFDDNPLLVYNNYSQNISSGRL